MTPVRASRGKDKLLAGETLATVLSCTYDAGAGQALAFGIPLNKHFLITFNYWAGGELHTGQFHLEKALPQGHLFSVTYDPAEPHRNSCSNIAPGREWLWLVLVLMLGIPLLAWLVTSVVRRQLPQPPYDMLLRRRRLCHHQTSWTSAPGHAMSSANQTSTRSSFHTGKGPSI